MLRNFEYQPNLDIVLETLGRFNIDLTEHVAIVKFEVITPDSFMWRILIRDGVYYLYAEDYVPGLKHVQTIFNKYIEKDNWSFVSPNTVIKFEESTPVKGATTYKKADDADEMMDFAIDSGHDFVFLVRSSEDPNDAQFSESAPRGFVVH